MRVGNEVSQIVLGRSELKILAQFLLVPFGLLKIQKDIPVFVGLPLERSEQGLTIIVSRVAAESAVTGNIGERNVFDAVISGIGIDQVLKLVVAQIGIAAVFIAAAGCIQRLCKGVERFQHTGLEPSAAGGMRRLRLGIRIVALLPADGYAEPAQALDFP